MKPTTSKPALVSFAAFAILFSLIGDVFAQSRGSIKLNEDAFAFAARLIKEGHSIADGKGAWSKHRPSTDEENEFIRRHGVGEYAKWHLGIDERFPAYTKRRYKFLMAISRKFTAAECSQRTPGPGNTATQKSKTQLPNWSAK